MEPVFQALNGSVLLEVFKPKRYAFIAFLQIYRLVFCYSEVDKVDIEEKLSFYNNHPIKIKVRPYRSNGFYNWVLRLFAIYGLIRITLLFQFPIFLRHENMVNIRDLEVNDYDNWLAVYNHYADHYEIPLTVTGIKTVWDWLMSESHPLNGIVAAKEEKLVGLAHFRAMPSPLRGENIGFLDDLIVVPEERGSGAARFLLDELKAIAQREQWSVIRWITKDDNYRARNLYDKLALKTDWNVYEMSIRA